MRIALATLGILASCGASDLRAAAIEWRIAPARVASEVQLTIAIHRDGDRSTNTGPIARSELDGLARAPAGSKTRFFIRRQAGALDCSGPFDGERGRGTCSFAPDPTFARGLAARGIAAPTARQSLDLTLHRADLSMVDALSRHGYSRPRVDQLVAAGIFGVTPTYVDALAAVGYRVTSVDRLVTFRIHKVEVDWIRALVRASPSLGRSSAEDLVTVRIHGVAPNEVEGLSRLGYGALTARQLIAMRIHGVTPDFARDARMRDGTRPTPDALVAMRIHGRASSAARAPEGL